MMNKERKDYYFEYVKHNSAYLNIRQIILNAGEYEDMVEKDICDWSITDITSYFRLRNSKSANYLKNLRSQFSAYTIWCLNNNLSNIGVDNFSNVNNEILANVVNIGLLESSFISRRELIDKIERYLNNDCDKFIILGAFEGIGVGQGDVGYNDFVNAKLSDISEDNIIKLISGREVKISPRLKDYARESYYADVFYQKNGRKLKKINDGTIIGIPERKVPISNVTAWLEQRIRKSTGYCELNIHSIGDLLKAGRFDNIKTNAHSSGNEMTFKEYELSHKEELDKIFGAESRATYLNWLNTLDDVEKRLEYYF